MPIAYPYKMSDWYGYDKDCSSLTAFSSSAKTKDPCNATLNQTYYHDGSFSLPAIGDRCYSDSAGATTLTAGSRAGTVFDYYVVNSNGEVTSKSLCP